MIEELKLNDGRIVTIKRLTEIDYEKNNNYEFVHNWLNQVNKYLGQEFEKKDLPKNKKKLYESLSNSNQYILIGALFKGKIIGSTNLSLNLKKKKMAHVATWGIAIHPDFQNQSLGTRLLTIIEDIAREKGLKKLEAEFFKGNKGAEYLYVEKLKYKVEGKRRLGAKLKDGTYTDKILIGKIIEDSIKD